MLVHALLDFAILSGTLMPEDTYAGAGFAILAYLVTAALVFTRRHRVEPRTLT